MSVKENKKIVTEMVARMGAGDSSVIDQLTTEDFVLRAMYHEKIEVNREQLKQTNDMGHVGMPDYSMTIDHIIAEGDKVMVLSTRHGTHTGEFLGIAPTGKEITINRFALYRLEDGKIAEAWAMDDALGQFQQLGLVPSRQEIMRRYQ